MYVTLYINTDGEDGINNTRYSLVVIRRKI